MPVLNLYNFLSQCYPPTPKFTERDLPDLKGKVNIKLPLRNQ